MVLQAIFFDQKITCTHLFYFQASLFYRTSKFVLFANFINDNQTQLLLKLVFLLKVYGLVLSYFPHVFLRWLVLVRH